MKRILTFFLVSIIFLTGCSSNEELAPGIELYDNGNYESLVEARDFFIDYLNDNSGDKDALNWLDKTNEELVDVLRSDINDLYGKLELKKALELVNFLVELDSDETNLDVQSMIVNDYNAQIEFDRFSSYMKSYYEETYTYFREWRDTIESVVLSDGDVKPIVKKASELLPKISNLSSDAQEQLLTLDDRVYIEAQTLYFNYTNNLEIELTRILTNDNLKTVNEINSTASRFTSEQFNQTFLRIQKVVNDHLKEVDNDGNKIKNIKGTLNLIDVEEAEVTDISTDTEDNADTDKTSEDIVESEEGENGFNFEFNFGSDADESEETEE